MHGHVQRTPQQRARVRHVWEPVQQPQSLGAPAGGNARKRRVRQLCAQCLCRRDAQRHVQRKPSTLALRATTGSPQSPCPCRCCCMRAAQSAPRVRRRPHSTPARPSHAQAQCSLAHIVPEPYSVLVVLFHTLDTSPSLFLFLFQHFFSTKQKESKKNQSNKKKKKR